MSTWRERRARNRDISYLWGEIHTLSELLEAARRESSNSLRIAKGWQDIAVNAQLEIEELKDTLKDLKS